MAVKPSSTKTYRSERRRADLTEREKHILRLVCDGLANAEIARRLSVPADVVKSSLQHIFRKIDAGVRGRVRPRADERPAGEPPENPDHRERSR